MEMRMAGDFAQKVAPRKGKKCAYDRDRIIAAMERVRIEKGLLLRPWAEAAGIAPGSLYGFLGPDGPQAPQIRFFVCLARAAGVSVSELIGEAEPDTDAAIARLEDGLQELRAEADELRRLLARRR